MKGNIHSIETFGTVDGPGIRYVVFMQGCTLRCAYCHNPDTWDMSCASMQMSVEELVKDISKYRRYIEGITVSGGEPLLQIDFLCELFSQVKEMGLTTCIDTSGVLFDSNNVNLKQKIDMLLSFTDLVLLDIKHINGKMHKELTGQSNENTLDFAKYLSAKGIPVWLRYVLLPNFNDDEQTLKEWKQFADTLDNIEKIELLPYHKMGIEKYKNLGIKYRLESVPVPTKEQIKIAKQILEIMEEN